MKHVNIFIDVVMLILIFQGQDVIKIIYTFR